MVGFYIALGINLLSTIVGRCMVLPHLLKQEPPRIADARQFCVGVSGLKFTLSAIMFSARPFTGGAAITVVFGLVWAIRAVRFVAATRRLAPHVGRFLHRVARLPAGSTNNSRVSHPRRPPAGTATTTPRRPTHHTSR